MMSIPVWSTRAHSKPYFESQSRTGRLTEVAGDLRVRRVLLVILITSSRLMFHIGRGEFQVRVKPHG